MNTPLHYDVGTTTLGKVLVALDGQGICAILLGASEGSVVRDLRTRFPHATLTHSPSRVARALRQVVDLVDGRRVSLDLMLAPKGTEFQQRVWRVLRDIPRGTTASYAEVARRIAAPGAVRAVARACGANPIALAIPCHRVVRQDGALSGYRWGIARKRQLLERESHA